MIDYNAPQFARNFGFWGEKEQKAILKSRVAIAGVGGDGFELGIRLARMGVSNFNVADPETFEAENLNRVPGATVDTIGRNKAIVFRQEVLKINPTAVVKVFAEGATEKTIDEFIDGVSLILDETELTKLELGTMVARAARAYGVPDVLVMNIGFAAQVTSFHPSRGMTFERFMGIPEDLTLDEVAKRVLQLSHCVPYIPPYTDLGTLRAVRNGAPLPSIVQGVGVASAIGASQVFLHIVSSLNLRWPKPIWAPQVAYMDSLLNTSGVSSHRILSHYFSLMQLSTRQKLGLNPSASYSENARLRRQKYGK